ncbi:ABC transporter substrate-binding protein [Arthrobacter sp. NPDC089319]|uniref:ABC transporter substrate-binding protein n=1 Tax=Arthrobacter sp. NPDC089319 TaxID=3155915 RepID=UPI00344A6C5E
MMTVAVALVASGCSTGASADKTDEGLTPVSLIAVPVIDLAAIQIGIEEGYFEDAGLDLTVDYAAGQALVPGVSSGQYNFGFTSTPSLLQARGKGLPLVAVSESVRSTGNVEEDHGGIFVAGDSDMESAKDLEGKTVAVNQVENLHQILTEISIEKAGGDPEKVEFIEIAFSEMPAALARKQVDAVATSEPFTTIVSEEGNKRIASQFVDADPDFIAGAYFSTESFVAENGDIAAQFKAAVDKSLNFAQENPDRVRAAVTEITDIEQALVDKLILPKFASDFPTEPIQNFAGMMLDAGVVQEPIDVQGLMAFVESQR